MSRCSICDYLDGYGSELTDKGPGRAKVHWHTKAKQFVCTDCSSSIQEVKNEFTLDDHWYFHVFDVKAIAK